jgi:hypothetical protein
VLTLAGLVVNVGSALVVTLFSDGGSASGSGWVYAQAAISLFLYQTLDATDGKQSYRSGQSTPLEELFDHGMDAMSTG